MTDKPTTKTLSQLYYARQKGMGDFAGLSQRIQTALVNYGYTKESLQAALQSYEFEPKKIPNLGRKGFEELLEWLDYK